TARALAGPLDRLAVDPAEATLTALGDSVDLTVTGYDAYDNVVTTDVDWGSSDTDVATVTSTGRVHAVANGTAYVFAATSELADSATVIVDAAAPSGDPYEPNDSLHITDIEVVAADVDPRLDSYDGLPGLPFRTATDPAVGSAAVAGAEDLDRYQFRLTGDSAVTVTLTETDGVAPLVARVRHADSGELWLGTLSAPAGGSASATIRLTSWMYFIVEVAAASPDQEATAPYTLELTGADIVDQDWLNTDPSATMEPNDLSVLAGATLPDSLPYDVIGTLGEAGDTDIDLMPVPVGWRTSKDLDLDHRGETGSITAQLYRRDPTTGQLEAVDGQTVVATDGETARGSVTMIDEEPHFLAITGAGDYDLCLRDRYEDCRLEAIEEVSGSDQVANTGEPLPLPFTVQVWGSMGYETFTDPVENALVKFSAEAGTLSATEVYSDANGQASVQYTAPTTPGVHQVKAWVTGVPVAWWGQDTLVFEVLVAPSLDGVEFAQVSAGGYHTCALDVDGVAYCWGDNSDGQLGTESRNSAPVPMLVDTDLRFTDISAGKYHTCAVATDGTGYCWGDGYYLGTGSDTYHFTPVAVDYTGTWQQIEAGHWHTCGIASDGQAYCWGDNYNGALGDGSTVDRLIPTAVASSVTFQSITAGIYSSCAVSTDGTGYCWGDGGTVGRAGAPYVNSVPQPVDGDYSFSTIHSGDWHVCAIGDGNVYCWGDNSLGQFGTGSASYGGVDSPTPGPSGYVQVDGAEEHTCGVTTTGDGACWGYNSWGQLGVSYDTRWASYSPLTITDPSAWLTISAAEQHSCGITTAGSLYCWGGNSSGQIGIGTSDSDEYPPTPVGLP
ncbi:MAG: Ig-like domain-containing protein, partial [Gemmatimonadota bacterium]